jgi:flagellar hook-basal body complex protein FliE
MEVIKMFNVDHFVDIVNICNKQTEFDRLLDGMLVDINEKLKAAKTSNNQTDVDKLTIHQKRLEYLRYSW